MTPTPDDPSPAEELREDRDAREPDEDARPQDASLSALEDRLDAAIKSLSNQNHRVEAYLDRLTEERRRELQGTDADQLTFPDPASAASANDEGVSDAS